MAEPTVELTLGAIEVGSNFSSGELLCTQGLASAHSHGACAVLYGLSLLQTYIYFTNCSGDRRAFKITVALVACAAVRLCRLRQPLTLAAVSSNPSTWPSYGRTFTVGCSTTSIPFRSLRGQISP
jgi:hypothetical protein